MCTKKLARIIAVVLACIFLILFVAPVFALQGGTITQFLQAYVTGSGGTPLKPDVITLADGTIAYAIEPAKISTRAETAYEQYQDTNETLKKGLEIIMQYGYPLNMGPDGAVLDEDNGIATDKARYATAIAIQAWAIHNGSMAPEGWTDFVSNPDALIAADGNDAVVSYIRYLLQKAKGQTEIPHGITAITGTGATISDIRMKETSTGYDVGFTVRLQNINEGYSIDLSALPTGTQAAGYTGEDGDNVTISLGPECADTYTIRLIAKDTRISENYTMYAPTNQDDASKLVAMRMTAPYAVSDVATQEIKLNKNSGQEWSFFGQQEEQAAITPVSAGDYPPVDGSLVVYDRETRSPVAGAQLTITDATGAQVKQGATDATGCVSIRDLGGGVYYAKQSAPAPGYTMDEAERKFAVLQTTSNDLYKGNMVFINDARTVTIVLKNGEKNIPNVAFKMADETGATVETVTTGMDGRAVFRGMANGTYKVVYESAPENTPEKEMEALKKLSREIFVTDAHDNDTAVYIFDIASMIGSTQAKTGEAEVILGTRLMFVAAILYLGGFAVFRIIFREIEE